MECGNPNAMAAQQRHSLAELGIRNPASADERLEARHHSDKVEEQAQELLRQPPMIKLRGRDLSLADYIKENRERFSSEFEPTTAIVRDLNYSVTVKRSGNIATLGNFFRKKPPQTELKILQNINFALRPREMTVLLGASKSGKTALLDILACRRPGNVTGTLSVNGKAPAHTGEAYHRMIGYVQQGDVHMPYLTVEETFRFSAFLRLPEEFPADARQDRVEALLQVLGLERARNTLIGDDFRRGVSGGEKRRVTVGVEWAKGARIMLLDEPTTGLDAGAALNIGRALRTISCADVPVLCALLQPGNELLSLFDNLLLLTRGQIAYWGPIKHAVPYFEKLGFYCPSEYSEAEFLASVAERPADFLAHQEGAQNLRTPEELIQAWNNSELAAQMNQQLQPIGDEKTDFALKNLPVEYPVGLGTQLKWLMWRGVKKLQRNWQRELLDYIVSIIFGLIIGWFFFRLHYHQVDLRARLAVLFYAIARLAFNSLSVIPTLYIERAVFYRQVGARYHSEVPYALQNILMNIPLGIIDVVTFGALVYWIAGLFPNGWRFMYFCLMLFTLRQTMNVFALLLSATVLAPIIASLIASSVSVVFLLFSGFLIIKKRLPSFWKFGPYISPIHYVFDGLALNELHGQAYACTASELQPPAIAPNFALPYPDGFASTQTCRFTSGDGYLAYQGLSTAWWHRWGDFAVILAFWIGFSACLVLALKYLSFAAFVEPTGKEDVSGRLEKVKKRAGDSKNDVRQDGATLVWQNLNYHVPNKQLLKNVQGFVRPGMLLALIGASGAGKTTLLDVLANRKNVGKVEGTILLNGQKRDKYFHRYIGYVEQNDIHLPSQTVLEAVSFAARSRLPENMDDSARSVVVQRVLDLLDMSSIAGQQVGLVGGLNPEQRKRLTIAVELAANPQILFLDEPTSGLDAAGADRVMTAVSEIAAAGTSVICTIHQPSNRIFALCTHVLLLQSGGEVMYFGPTGDHASDVLGYFSRNFHTQPAGNANPADFLLTQSKVKEGERSPAEAWRETEEAKKAESDLEEAKQDKGGEKFKSKYPLGYYAQIGLALKRNWFSLWRNPFSQTLDLFRSILLGVVFGTIFWRRPSDQFGVSEQFGAIFFSAVFANLSSFAYLPAVYFQRPLFARERAEGFYRVPPYVIGLLGANIPFLALNCILFSTPFYWIAGLRSEAGSFFFYLLIVFTLTNVAVAFAHLVAVWSPTPVSAGVIFASTFAFFALVAGFLLLDLAAVLTQPRPPDQQPVYFKWGYWISFFHWFLEPLAVNNFAGRRIHCRRSEYTQVPITLVTGEVVFQPYCPITSGDQLLESIGVVKERMWVGVGVLFGIYMGFVLLTMLGLRVLKPIKR